MESIVTALITGALASLITALVTKSNSDKKNAIENITQERKKWRDDLRGATVALRRYFENKNRLYSKGSGIEGKENKGVVFYSAAEAKAFFEIRLNLGDPEDEKLLAILDRLVTHDCASRKPSFQLWENKENVQFKTEDLVVEDLLAYFEEGMSHNLKHDWERTKREVSAKNTIKCIIVIIITLISLCCLGYSGTKDGLSKSLITTSGFCCYQIQDTTYKNFVLPYNYSKPDIQCQNFSRTEISVDASKNVQINENWLMLLSPRNILLFLLYFFVVSMVVDFIRDYSKMDGQKTCRKKLKKLFSSPKRCFLSRHGQKANDEEKQNST